MAEKNSFTEFESIHQALGETKKLYHPRPSIAGAFRDGQNPNQLGNHPSAHSPTSSTDDIFQSLKTIKVDSIKGVIEDIEELIQKRNELSDAISTKIDKMLNTLNNVELEINAAHRDDTALQHDMMTLKGKKVDLEKLRIEEQIENWKDIAQLKHELRERVKEFKEKEGRLDMLDKILSE
ncbi:hypothetical protein HYU19_01565 [Candidatus Woesearchaeota archaeon]|nr:hypothetical protein [Candidatus Woesearchaeota archaeon]